MNLDKLRAILASEGLRTSGVHRVISFHFEGPILRKYLPTPYDLEAGGSGVSVTQKTRGHYIITTKNRDATDAVLDWIEENNIPYAIE